MGVTTIIDPDEDEDAFMDRMKEIHQELAELNDRAVELAEKITLGFGELLD